ncbi:hypothetical protein HY029_03380 [Candidatus Gottesmanbacteria bacterium]|nr:hypothetical protein [Candidatus Gottesmanbacteria bacterium]
MKKIATLVGAAALLAATLVPALAVNSCGNSTTGPGSNNTCTVTNTSNVSVNNVNDAQIINNVRTSSNTGGNSASNNTLGGSIVTGNASLNTTVSSVANVNTTNVTAGFGGGNNMGGNSVTGPFSTNNAFITNGYRVDAYNSNTATVKNDVNTTADTGNNSADNNTGPATIRTGNAWLGTGVNNHVNDSLTQVALGGASGNNTAFNSTTGPFSANNAVVTNSANVTLNNVNDLQVTNWVNVLARTGRNSASNNTLGGDITTGNATGGVVVGTEGNINTSSVAMALGGFANNASSNVTGPSSDNNAFITNAQNVVVDNWNDKCRSHNADRLTDPLYRDGETGNKTKDCDPANLGVLNDVFASSDAGNSTANNNTGPGSVMAGWASLVQNVLTHLNDNLNVIGL